MTKHLPFAVSPRPFRLRVEDFLMLDDGGAFEGYGRTELIEGEIFVMNSQHRPHALIKSRFHLVLAAALGELGNKLEAIIEGSVLIPPHNMPEPDIVVTDAPEGDGFIPIESVALVIEVADTSIAFDLGAKRRLYAGVGIPEYWVADVNARIIHQMWQPRDGAYAESRAIPFGASIASATIEGLAVATGTL